MQTFRLMAVRIKLPTRIIFLQVSTSTTRYYYTLFIIHLRFQRLDVFAVDIIVIIHKLVDCTIRCKLDYAIGNSLDEFMVVA